MDLELSDEQRWLGESVDTLLDREWPAIEAVSGADDECRRRVWDELVAFGALSIGDAQGISAVEACLIARALGAHLAVAPFIASAAVRLALVGQASSGASLPASAAVALAWLEPGTSWSSSSATSVRAESAGLLLGGEKVAIEQADLAQRLAVLVTFDGDPALAFVPIDASGIALTSRPSFDLALPMSAARFEDVTIDDAALLTGDAARRARQRLGIAGSLLAAAEAVGAADRVLGEATVYARERRQFGRAVASFQSVRHILADMYVRTASGWSTVLYAAAAFDEADAQAAQTASIAKAYVSRTAREVAEAAMQVFGGIAFTAEHSAHSFLRRIVVRSRQFGDSAEHERALGAWLSAQRSRTPSGVAEVSAA